MELKTEEKTMNMGTRVKDQLVGSYLNGEFEVYVRYSGYGYEDAPVLSDGWHRYYVEIRDTRHKFVRIELSTGVIDSGCYVDPSDAMYRAYRYLLRLGYEGLYSPF